MTDKQLAKQLISNYFEAQANRDSLNFEGFQEAFLIKTDDKVLLEHIKAWINILTRAKEEIENEQKDR